jgi:hypothetical protein
VLKLQSIKSAELQQTITDVPVDSRRVLAKKPATGGCVVKSQKFVGIP